MGAGGEGADGLSEGRWAVAIAMATVSQAEAGEDDYERLTAAQWLHHAHAVNVAGQSSLAHPPPTTHHHSLTHSPTHSPPCSSHGQHSSGPRAHWWWCRC